MYVALAVWVGLLVQAYRKGSYWLFAIFGIGILLVLNVGYFINGVPDSIAFFIGIYDVLDNLGTNGAPALASCPDNACSVWGDRYTNHPSWGVACAVMGVLAIRNGDHANHRIWMIRFVGAMWGAYWLFRVMLFVLGPLLRQWDSAAILSCIWFSAPLGILIAEFVRRKLIIGHSAKLQSA